MRPLFYLLPLALAAPAAALLPDDPPDAPAAPAALTAEQWAEFRDAGLPGTAALQVVAVTEDVVTLQELAFEEDPPLSRVTVPRAAFGNETPAPAAGVVYQPGVTVDPEDWGSIPVFPGGRAAAIARGEAPQLAVIEVVGLSERYVLWEDTPKYGDGPVRRVQDRRGAEEEFRSLGRSLALGRTVRDGDVPPVPTVELDEDALKRVLTVELPRSARDADGGAGLTVAAVTDEVIWFRAVNPERNGGRPFYLWAWRSTAERVFGGLNLPPAAFTPGTDLRTLLPDAPAGPADLAAEDAADERLTEVPGLWHVQEMDRFLTGEMDGVESITVTEIDGGAGFGSAEGRGRVRFRVNRSDELGPQAGEMALAAARTELAFRGLSLKVGETLRPTVAADGRGGLGFVPGSDFSGPMGSGRLGRGGSGGGGFGGPAAWLLLDRPAAPDAAITAAVDAVRDAEGDAKADAEAELAALLAERFDAAQAGREEKLAALEAKVAALRDLHDKRAAAKAEIVARRAETLLRAADGLGWDDPGDQTGGGDDPKRFGLGGGGGFGGPATLPPGSGTGGGGFGGSGAGGGFGGGRDRPARTSHLPLTGQMRPLTMVRGTAGRGPVEVTFRVGPDDRVRFGDELPVVRDRGDGAPVRLGSLKITEVAEDLDDPADAFFGATGTFSPADPGDPPALDADDDRVLISRRPLRGN